jgi:hypothetical protein
MSETEDKTPILEEPEMEEELEPEVEVEHEIEIEFEHDPEPEMEVEPVAAEEEESDLSSGDDFPVKEKKEKEILNEDEMNGFWARQFKRMARTAWIHLGVSLLVSAVLSAIALTVGGFEVSVENAGWQSRGTPIADSQTQLMLTEAYQDYLFTGGKEAWNDLLSNVQPGWETDAIGAEDSDRRRLTISSGTRRSTVGGERRLPFHLDARLLQESDALEGCDLSWYTNWTRLEDETHLWPVWKAENKKDSILDPDLLKDLCFAELNTQAVLEANGLCFGCEEGCLPPYSVVLYARLMVENGFNLECKELSEQWAAFQEQTEVQWAQCVTDLKSVYNPKGAYEYPQSCPVGFSPTLVEENFDMTSIMGHSSSIFATSEEHVDDLYELVDSFDRGSSKINGAYDTQYEDFNGLFTDAAVGRDMVLACGSAFVTTLAMIVHTRSPFITVIGLLQIILSFPLAYFVYTFLGGLDFCEYICCCNHVLMSWLLTLY